MHKDTVVEYECQMIVDYDGNLCSLISVIVNPALTEAQKRFQKLKASLVVMFGNGEHDVSFKIWDFGGQEVRV